MGSAGHAFVAHTKALSPNAQVRADGELPPHPLVVRPGQRYWPRNAKRRLVVQVRRVRGNEVLVERGGRRDDVVRTTASALLAVRADGQGRHYQFQGFASRTYETYACVMEVGGPRTTLCVPEWHPRVPVLLFASLIPGDARRAGAWLRLRCDLSAPTAARLSPHDLQPTDDPGPDRVHRPNVR